ncbi:calcium-binding protein CML42-like [Rhodamnia argentea]|uniref:Calcium-binding protein CML42-like n=1 Tax=Rhodamnia argentea TaxID=178133 RepID=A0ABM3HRB8_9MYRT|nr:calcium-binding protein CML42-like [Rhodamnia argentea]
MEVAPATQANGSSSSCRRALGAKSVSFRLHSPSLNSLRLRRTFDLFDKNGDGIITPEELSQALALLGLDADLSDLDSILRSHIKPGSDGLRFDDFVALHQSVDEAFFGGGGDADDAPALREEADLSEAFKVFDEDGDGYICARELKAVLAKLGLPEGEEIGRVERMITSVDRNHDGRVDFFEFKDMMRSVLVNSS